MVAEDPELKDSHVYNHPSLRVRLVGIAIVCFFSLLVLLAWLAWVGTLTTKQPLHTTACTPESYSVPAPGFEGPPQSECDVWFDVRDDTWLHTDPITVAGQVCNSSDDEAAYQTQVAWESVDDPGTRFLVLDLPLTYQPGCDPPYEFAFEVPELMAMGLEEGDSMGRWRLSGHNFPVSSRLEIHQWEVTGTVELIVGPREP